MLCATATVAAKEQTAHLNTRVAAGESQITRLRDLPAGAFVRVVVEIDGQTSVLLLDEKNVQLPRDVRKPLVSGETSDRMSLAARIPEAGNYYLLVDNESGTTERQYSLEITVSACPLRHRERVFKRRYDRRMRGNRPETPRRDG